MISLQDVTKSYDGRPVLSHLSFSLDDGAALRVTGQNGAGKSTLLKIVLGLVRPDSGRVDGLAGRPVAAVFQEDRLCGGLSAVANLRLVVPALSTALATAALAGVGLPQTAMTGPVAQLSGGQRRRVAIARALVAPSEIVCLDEPFTGVDADSLPDVIAAVRAGLAGKTVLLVTHDDAQAAAFDAAQLAL